MPDPTLLLLGALVVVMIVFTWRGSRKRKAEAEEMQRKLVPGVEIMTQHGIFGTLVSIDDDSNEAIIETTPGTLLRVHRQTLSQVITPDEPESDDVEDDAAESDASSEPEFGERGDDSSASDSKRGETE